MFVKVPGVKLKHAPAAAASKPTTETAMTMGVDPTTFVESVTVQPREAVRIGITDETRVDL